MECVYIPELRNAWFLETHSPGWAPRGNARHPQSLWAPQWRGGGRDSFPRQFHFPRHGDLLRALRVSSFFICSKFSSATYTQRAFNKY